MKKTNKVEKVVKLLNLALKTKKEAEKALKLTVETCREYTDLERQASYEINKAANAILKIVNKGVHDRCTVRLDARFDAFGKVVGLEVLNLDELNLEKYPKLKKDLENL